MCAVSDHCSVPGYETLFIVRQRMPGLDLESVLTLKLPLLYPLSGIPLVDSRRLRRCSRVKSLVYFRGIRSQEEFFDRQTMFARELVPVSDKFERH